jgi:hypothetical protein
MKAGDVLSKSERSVLVVMSVFIPEKQQPDSIHIRISGAGGKDTITTVTDNTESERGHPHLFRQLKRFVHGSGREGAVC